MSRETEERQGKDIDRRQVSVATIARKSAETESSTGALRGRVGNHGMQRLVHGRTTRVAQRDPDEKKDKAAKSTGQRQQVYIIRDKGLAVGTGNLVHDLEEFKTRVMATKITSDWTLVLSIHGSEELLGAQSPPDWKKNATFYKAADIEKLFNDDKAFVKWRNQFGPNRLSMVSCQISKDFEGTLISNLTRAGADKKRQPARGLGEGCKPMATAFSLNAAPKTRAEFDKLKDSKKNSIRAELQKLNEEWGYYGADPVPESLVIDYYYDEDPKAAWVKVEVTVGRGHSFDELEKTGIPFWNRTTGDKSGEFRDKCTQGAAKLREHKPAVPEVGDE
jgi:hypothetical protein